MTTPVPAATDKRFRRGHVKPSRKRTASSKYVWLGARVVAGLIVVSFAAYVGVTSIAAAATLQIGHLQVRGNQRLSTGEVLSLVEGLRGQNILAVKLDQWQEKLLSSPWVESATIRRVLPSTLQITIHERQPMGVGRMQGAGGGVVLNGLVPSR